MTRFLSRFRSRKEKLRKAESSAPFTSAKSGPRHESTTAPASSTQSAVGPTYQIKPDNSPYSQVAAFQHDISPKNFWEDAFQSLQQDEMNSKLMFVYKEILLQESGVEIISLHDGRLPVYMSALIDTKLKLIDDASWRVQVQGRSIEVRATVDGIVKALLYAQSFMGAAVAAEPHAALAWAGISLFLPLLVNFSQQPRDLVRGLNYISDLLCRFSVTERLYREQVASVPTSSVTPDMVKLRKQFETDLIKLYAKILEYQGRALYQMKHSTAIRLARDMIKFDDWASLSDELRECELACTRTMKVLDSEKLSNGMKSLNDRLQQLLNMASAHYSANVNLQHTAEDAVKTLKLGHALQANQQRADQEDQCVQNFFISPYEEHMNRNPDAVNGTCRWLLDNANFEKWRGARFSSLLWVSADPGCGKSVLSKLIIKLLSQELEPLGRPRTVCYFFFKEDDPLQRTAENAVCALLHQLLSKSENAALVTHAMAEFRKSGINLRQSFTRMWKIFMNAVTDPQAGEVICILDALDECEEMGENRGRYQLIDSLRQFHRDHVEGVRDNQAWLKVLVTSRPYIDIERRFKALTQHFPTIRLAGEEETEKITKEIDLVIKDHVKLLGEDLDLAASTIAALEANLLKTTHRTYLWLRLIFDLLREQLKTTEKHLLRVTEEIPDTVDKAYEAILKRIPKRELGRAKKLLHIVVAATRPLTVKEMNIALSIDGDHRSFDDLDLESDEAFQVTIRNICGLFITVVDSRIYLIHQTARSFLVSESAKQMPSAAENLMDWKNSLSSQQSNLLLATICVNYLLFRVFKTSPLKLDISGVSTTDYAHFFRIEEYVVPRSHALLQYASQNWGFHVRQAKIQQNSTLATAIHKLCKTDSGRFNTWFSIAQRAFSFQVQSKIRLIRAINALEVGSVIGVEIIVRQALENPCISGRSFGESLSIASILGYDEVIRVILDAGRVLNLNGPLQLAIQNQHLDAVKLLVEKGAGKEDLYQRALGLAAIHCFSEVIELLADRGADVKRPLINGMPMLMPGVYASNTTAVSTLLKKGVSPNDLHDSRITPLSWAVSWNNVEMTALLLKHGADVNLVGLDGWSPIARALASGGFAREMAKSSPGVDSTHMPVPRLLLTEPTPPGSVIGEDAPAVSPESTDGEGPERPTGRDASGEYWKSSVDDGTEVESCLMELAPKDMVITMLLDREAKLDSLNQAQKRALSAYHERQAKRKQLGIELQTKLDLLSSYSYFKIGRE